MRTLNPGGMVHILLHKKSVYNNFEQCILIMLLIYKMVTQNTERTCEGQLVFSEEKKVFVTFFRNVQILQADQNEPVTFCLARFRHVLCVQEVVTHFM